MMMWHWLDRFDWALTGALTGAPWLGVTVGFMFLMVVALVGLLYARLPWLVKATGIALALLVTGGFALSYRATLGWPVALVPPTQFRLAWAQVNEPSAVADDPGAIYLWLVPVHGRVPRAMQLPYSKQLRDQLFQARKKRAQGADVYMSLRRVSGQRLAGTDIQLAARQQLRLDFVPPPDTVPKKPH